MGVTNDTPPKYLIESSPEKREESASIHRAFTLALHLEGELRSSIAEAFLQASPNVGVNEEMNIRHLWDIWEAIRTEAKTPLRDLIEQSGESTLLPKANRESSVVRELDWSTSKAQRLPTHVQEKPAGDPPREQVLRVATFEGVVIEFIGEDAEILLCHAGREETRLMSAHNLRRNRIVSDGQAFNLRVEEVLMNSGLAQTRTTIEPVGDPSVCTVLEPYSATRETQTEE